MSSKRLEARKKSARQMGLLEKQLPHAMELYDDLLKNQGIWSMFGSRLIRLKKIRDEIIKKRNRAAAKDGQSKPTSSSSSSSSSNNYDQQQQEQQEQQEQQVQYSLLEQHTMKRAHKFTFLKYPIYKLPFEPISDFLLFPCFAIAEGVYRGKKVYYAQTISHGPDFSYINYLLPVCSYDWFMRYLGNKYFPNPGILLTQSIINWQQLPTVLANYIAAEKGIYHLALKAHDLIHPSTQVLYFDHNLYDIEHTIIHGRTGLASSIIEKQLAKIPDCLSSFVLKIPFSSSSKCVVIGVPSITDFKRIMTQSKTMNQNLQQFKRFVKDTTQRLDDALIPSPERNCIASSYCWIIQKAMSWEKKTDPLEIRCFTGKDGNIIVGVINNGVKVLGKNGDFDFTPPPESSSKDLTPELLALIVDNVSSIRDLIKKTYNCFRNIRITKSLVMPISKTFSESSQYKNIATFLQDERNYMDKPITDKFLRIDVMYWEEDGRFYVNEVETWACGHFQFPDVELLANIPY